MDNTFFLSAQTFADAAGGEVSFHAETNAIQLSDGTASMEVQTPEKFSAEEFPDDCFLPAEQIAEELGYRIAHQDDSSITFVKSFQTMRLIVQSPKTVLQGNEYGAIETIDDGDGTYVMQFDSIENTKAAYEMLLDTKGVESVEEDLIVALEEVPMEQPDSAAEQYLSWGSQRIGADEWLNDMTEEQKNRPVVVAVLDTMAYSDHSALSGRLLEGTSMMGSENQEDIHGHGTHVSGIVADATKGTQVKILPVQVLSGTTGKGSALGAALGIQWAVSHGADVINMSLSGEYSYANGSHYLDKVIRQALANQIVVVASAGNDSTFSGLNPKTKYQIVASNEAGESLPLLVTTTKKPVSSGSLGGSGGGNFVHDAVPPLAEDPPVAPADLLDTLQVTIQANGSYQFLVDGNNDTENIQIEVTDPAIAAVTLADGADPRGAKYQINAKTVGTTEIQVTYQGQTSVLKVTVSEPKASLTLDTTSYTLAPGQQYTIGAILKDENGSRLTAEQMQNLIDSGKLIVRDSRTGSVFDLKQLPNGNFQVTGKQEGAGYVMYEIGGVHASVAITVQNDILPHGDDTRNTIFWPQLLSR